MSVPQVDPAVEQAAEEELGVILKTKRSRNIVAGTLGVIGAVLTSTTSAVGVLALTVGVSHIPGWVPLTLAAAYAAYAPLTTIGNGIWKANIR